MSLRSLLAQSVVLLAGRTGRAGVCALVGGIAGVAGVAGCGEESSSGVRPAISGYTETNEAAGTSSATGSDAPVLPTTTMSFAGRELTLEVADDEDETARGLMHRRSMPRDHGMIFVFPKPAYLSFYMKNTTIPLDIVFVDDEQRIDSVRQMTPLDENTFHRPNRPVRWALEFNRGVPAELGMRPGVRLPIPVAAGGTGN
ncbi:MAG: DUF192 domain-containing protein [Phycisphaerae bacterium]